MKEKRVCIISYGCYLGGILDRIYEKLRESGNKYDVILGLSAGAGICAWKYADRTGGADLYSQIVDLRFDDVWEWNISLADAALARFKDVTHIVPPEDTERDTESEYVIVTIEPGTQKKRLFTSKIDDSYFTYDKSMLRKLPSDSTSLFEVAKASCSLPLILPVVEIDGEQHMDGFGTCYSPIAYFVHQYMYDRTHNNQYRLLIDMISVQDLYESCEINPYSFVDIPYHLEKICSKVATYDPVASSDYYPEIVLRSFRPRYRPMMLDVIPINEVIPGFLLPLFMLKDDIFTISGIKKMMHDIFLKQKDLSEVLNSVQNHPYVGHFFVDFFTSSPGSLQRTIEPLFESDSLMQSDFYKVSIG